MIKHIDPKLGIAYLDGQLDAAQQAQLERHLADCSTCQAQLREHQTMHDILHAAGKAFSPQPVQAPNWSAVRPMPGKGHLWKTLLNNGAQLAAAGAAILLILVVIWQLRPVVPAVEPTALIDETPIPTAEPAAVETAVSTPITSIFPHTSPVAPTAAATKAPTVTATIPARQTITGSNISAVSLNNQGRAAFVVDGMLYVETESGTAVFSTIANHVLPNTLDWSADGQELLFFSQPDAEEQPVVLDWSAKTGLLTPLSDLVTRQLPDIPFTHVHWADEGRKLLLTASGQLIRDSEWDSSVWLADLDTGHLTMVVEATALKDVEWLNSDSFMMMVDCGRNCTILMAFDTTKTLLWKAYRDRPDYEAASDLFVLQSEEQRVLVLNTYDQPQTIDALDTATGTRSTLLELDDDVQFVVQPPMLAANGQILIFQVVDEVGQTAVQTLNLKSGAVRTIEFAQEQFTFGTGSWDSAGNYFIYSGLDPDIGAGYVYLWQPVNDAANLIHAAAGDGSFHNFVWTEDGRRVFFNLDNQELWQYDLITEELRAIAGH
ncbi:MAG: zf-HC2 domain-containing protein [Candidatus Promineifilaceae bacterium]